MDSYQMGYAIGHMMGALFVLGVIIFGIVAITRSSKKRRETNVGNAFLFPKLGLRAGESPTALWSGIYADGTAIIFTITTAADLVIGFPSDERQPVRIPLKGARASSGASVFVNWPSLPNLTEVFLAAPGHAPFTMMVDPAAMPAIAHWSQARP